MVFKEVQTKDQSLIDENHNVKQNLTEQAKESIKSKAAKILDAIKAATSTAEIESLLNDMNQLMIMAGGEIPELTNILSKIDSAKSDRTNAISTSNNSIENQDIKTQDNLHELENSFEFESLHKKNQETINSAKNLNKFLTKDVKIDKDGNIEDFDQFLTNFKTHAQKLEEHDHEALESNINKTKEKIISDLQEKKVIEARIDTIENSDQNKNEKKKKNARQYLKALITSNSNNSEQKNNTKNQEHKILIAQKVEKEKSINKNLSELNTLEKDKYDIKVAFKEIGSNTKKLQQTTKNTNQVTQIVSKTQIMDKKSKAINGVGLMKSDQLAIAEFKPTSLDDLESLAAQSSQDIDIQKQKKKEKPDTLTSLQNTDKSVSKEKTISTKDKFENTNISSTQDTKNDEPSLAEAVKKDDTANKINDPQQKENEKSTDLGQDKSYDSTNNTKSTSVSSYMKNRKEVKDEMEGKMQQEDFNNAVKIGAMVQHKITVDRDQYDNMIMTPVKPSPTPAVGKGQSQSKNNTGKKSLNGDDKHHGR